MYILHDAGDANDMIDASSGWMNYYYDGTMSHTNIRYIKVKLDQVHLAGRTQFGDL